MNKKILLVILIVLCLTLGACGKKKQEETKKEEEKVKTQVIKCTAEENDSSIEIVMEQNMETYQLVKATLKTVSKVEFGEDVQMTDEQIKEILCKDDKGNYNSCVANVKDGMMSLDLDFNVEKYAKELENAGIKLDKDTFTNYKKQTEESGYTCTIS